MTTKAIRERREVEFKAQIAALEQLVEVHEMTVVKQSKNLELTLAKLQDEVDSRKQAQDDLVTLHASLENLAERTSELEGTYEHLYQQIHEHHKTLQQERDIFMQGPVMTFTWQNNASWQVEHVSANVMDILGYSPEELLNGSVQYAELIHQDDVQLVIDEVASNSVAENSRFIHEPYRLISSAGEVIWVFDSTTMVRNNQGDITHYQGYIVDITNLKKAEQEWKIMESQLHQAQKLESIGQLAAGIAHEINTPAQFVSTNIDFLDEAALDISNCIEQLRGIAKDAPPAIRDAMSEAIEDADWEYLAEELPKAISQSKDGVKRISSIVLAMKEFSHPGGNTKNPADLNHIIKTTITVAKSEWKYVANLETDLDQNLPPVPLLTDKMGQVILILLVNAAHAIAEDLGEDPESEKGIITISTSYDDDWAEIRISDSGTGIPEKVRERIFDPFFTTKTVGKGTGQGLTIAHDVITEKHGGTFTFETAMGQGTTFIVGLPLKP